MKKIKKIRTILFISAYLLIGFSLISPAMAAKDLPGATAAFTPQVTIPGTEFQQGVGINISQTIGSNTVSNLLGRYISSFYNWGLSIVGVIAVLVLMAAGVMWITSGGDSNRIAAAKKMIIGSISGAALLIGAWFLLNTINPNLIKLPALSLATVDRNALKNPCYEKSDGTGCKINKTDKINTGYCTNQQCLPCKEAGASCADNYECKSSTAACGLGDITGLKFSSFCNRNFCFGEVSKENERCGANRAGICVDGSCPDGTSRLEGGIGCDLGLGCCGRDNLAGERCGADKIGKCYEGSISCPDNFTHVQGGTDCTSGYICCEPSGNINETCGGGRHPGVCRSGSICPGNNTQVSEGKDCVSGVVCCENPGTAGQECGLLNGGTCETSCSGLTSFFLPGGRNCVDGYFCCSK